MFTKADEAKCRHMTLASHVLYIEGQNDVNHGQISSRGSDDGLFLIRGAALGFDEVEEADFLHVNLQGQRLGGNRILPPEWPIHGAIYSRRSDVRAIVHTHARAATLFSTTSERLEALSHDACPFIERLCYFSDTTNTITDWQMAERLAVKLDGCIAALLQNHGIVVLGSSIKEAVVLSIMLERACSLQLELRMPPQRVSTPSDIVEKRNFIFSSVAIATYWDYYLRKLKRVRAGTQLPEF